MKRLIISAVLLAAIAAMAAGQAIDLFGPEEAEISEEGAAVVDERLQLAVSSAIYPVTPGDVYTLTFIHPQSGLVTTEAIVMSDYLIYLGVFGTIDARGLTLPELKPLVEGRIEDSYRGSLPSLNLAAVGLFQVSLSGAIPRSARVTAWGLSRLSDAIHGAVGSYTSLRRVTVTSQSNRRTTYDLFRAIDQGEFSQDPYLQPGDSVSFVRRSTVVTVTGEVQEPGEYELLTSERLDDLLDFCQGFTPAADSGRLVVQRPVGETVQQIRVGSAQDAANFRFQNGDTLIVPPRVIPRPVVFVEGAVRLQIDIELETDEDSTTPVFNRITRPLTVGDTLYGLILDIQDDISPFADLENGYVVRHGLADPIRINLREVLYQQSDYVDFELQPFDRIVIPLDRPYVMVSGDVASPGYQPYNPSEDFTYYLSLAGVGAEEITHARSVVQVFDSEGNEQPVGTEIRPGYTVYLPIQEDRFVVVSGEVPDPGAYPYDPGRDFPYYLRLAGVGADGLAVVRNTVEVYDEQGNLQTRGTGILPEYTVFVPTNEEAPSPEGAVALVTGAVNIPGLYEIFGERTASYYIQQAGGIDTEVSADGAYVVRNAAGEELPQDTIISSGDSIEVVRNGFVYNFNRYFPIITGGLTFITTIITIVNALNQSP
jgi:polysaccharide export outer membrane protein